MSPLRLLSPSFFVHDLKYQMNVLPVELRQSFSWSKYRRSMEYSVKNQIANRLISIIDDKKNSFIKICLEQKVLLHSNHSIWKEKHFSWILANAIFYRQCDTWHLSCDLSRQMTFEIYCIIENLSLWITLFWIYIQNPPTITT